MAKRQRDHKAEYQRRKEIAKAAGAKSVRQYKRQRSVLKLPRSQPFSMRAIRRASVEWSADHSHVKNSRYSPDFTDREAIDYYAAYVAPHDKNVKLKRLHDYLIGHDLVTEEEWVANYLRSD